MDWAIDHRFRDLEGKDRWLKNKSLAGLFMDTAEETIRFRLDASGAELEAEASSALGSKKAAGESYARRLELTGPFLLLVRKRGSTQPVLALWIEDFELLRPVQ